MESILQNRKNYQRNKILNIIRTGHNISRNDVKKISGYSMTTVIGSVNDLLAEHLILEEECMDDRVGRRPVWLKINPDGGYCIGVEFNRNEMHCVIIDFLGKAIYHNGVKIAREERSKDSIITKLEHMIQDGIDFLGRKKCRIIGIGIGVPGYSDKKTGTAFSYRYIEGWHDVPLREIIEKKFGIPCYLENNINIMVYAYKWFIYNGKCEDMLFVSVRTGARVIPVINNRPIISNKGFSGEIGHLKLGNGSNLCECGQYGCINSEISEVAIVNKIMNGIRIGCFQDIWEKANHNSDHITVQLFVESALEGHKDSLTLEKHMALIYGNMLGVLVNIFAPQRIILFGTLNGLGDLLLNDIREVLKSYAIQDNLDNLHISYSQFGRDLGALGAGAYVIQSAFPFIEERV